MTGSHHGDGLDVSPLQTIEDSPPDLIRDALAFLFAEHYRQRQLCGVLVQLADAGVFHAEALPAVTSFIETDLALHVIDEEEDLFPLLRQRCKVEDDIDRALDLLSAQHVEAAGLAVAATRILKRAIAESTPPAQIEGGAETFRRFAAHLLRHVALENAVVLPIARVRLSTQDVEALGDRLAARRPCDAGTPAELR